MISKIGIFILLISFVHLACSFPPSLVDTSKCKKRNGNFPKPGSLCKSYFKCTNWNPIEIVCPEDQHFFPSKGYCVWPEEYPCLERPKSKDCPFPNGKFLKSKTGCKVYFDCCNGVPTEKKCANGLLFDNIRGKCDWSELVICPEEPKSKDCTRPDGKFLKPGTGCKIFYECRNGISIEKTCSGDLLFDPKTENCEWPEIYTCIEEPKSKVCTRPNGKFLRPGTRCRIYYDCRNGGATEKRCPEDQLFDPSRENCEWTEIYTCVEDINIIETTTQLTSTSNIVTSPLISISTGENVISTTDEHITESTTQSTPAPTIVTSTIVSVHTEEIISTTNVSITGSAKQSTSTSRAKTSPGFSISTERKDIKTSSNPTSPKMLTSHSDASSSEADKMSSTKSYTYTEIVTEVSPEATQTVINKDTESTTTTSGLTDFVTTHIFCPKSDGHFPHPHDRHKFIACVGGNPIIMDCPENLVYEHKTKSCQYDKK